MTDKERIEVLRSALTRCRELFDEIRNDWSDPRSECRAGWAVIHEALHATADEQTEPVGEKVK